MLSCSQVVKAADLDSVIRRFKPYQLSQGWCQFPHRYVGFNLAKWVRQISSVYPQFGILSYCRNRIWVLPKSDRKRLIPAKFVYATNGSINICGCSLMVECQFPMLKVRVRFSSSAPKKFDCCIIVRFLKL